MTVVHKPYIIIEIEEIKKAEVNIMGKTFMQKPELDIYRIKAVLKSWIEKSQEGYKLLEKLGHGDKFDKLTLEYLDTAEAFTVTIPVTAKNIEWNKWHLGGEIMIAYYPSNVWATFHTDNELDNNNDKERLGK